MTQTQPSTAWKPQSGKPAMTRDGKMLVTDLVCMAGRVYVFLWSPRLKTSWYRSGESTLVSSLDLIKPTAEILAAHGIDADGKPIVTEDCSIPGSPPQLGFEDCS